MHTDTSKLDSVADTKYSDIWFFLWLCPQEPEDSCILREDFRWDPLSPTNMRPKEVGPCNCWITDKVIGCWLHNYSITLICHKSTLQSKEAVRFPYLHRVREFFQTDSQTNRSCHWSCAKILVCVLVWVFFLIYMSSRSICIAVCILVLIKGNVCLGARRKVSPSFWTAASIYAK